MARRLSEEATILTLDYLKANIATALAAVRTDRADAKVTTEPPPTNSYFVYPKAHGYKCPAIFVIDDGMDFRQPETKANFVNSKFSLVVSVKVEDKDLEKLTFKAWRYQAALHQLLDLTELASSDNLVKLNIVVSSIKPSGIYTIPNAEPDSTATFFKEVTLRCTVNYFEGF